MFVPLYCATCFQKSLALNLVDSCAAYRHMWHLWQWYSDCDPCTGSIWVTGSWLERNINSSHPPTPHTDPPANPPPPTPPPPPNPPRPPPPAPHPPPNRTHPHSVQSGPVKRGPGGGGMPGSEASWIQHGLDREAAQALNFPLPSYVNLGK